MAGDRGEDSTVVLHRRRQVAALFRRLRESEADGDGRLCLAFRLPDFRGSLERRAVVRVRVEDRAKVRRRASEISRSDSRVDRGRDRLERPVRGSLGHADLQEERAGDFVLPARD